MISLGLAQWSTSQWQGQLFSKSGASMLSQYSQVFHTVEGNTTFYALPKPETVERWKQESADGFSFCFKLPRSVTHEGYLDPEHADLHAFFQRIAPLEEKIGPFMLQLPSSVGATALDALEQFLTGLPRHFRYSLEVRNPVFFQKGDAEQRLNQLLQKLGIDRTSLDSRALFSAPASSEALIDAQKKKPKLPVHAIATGQRPMVRFIGRMEEEHNIRYWQPWIAKLQQWLSEKRKPVVFIHTPDNIFAPVQARRFYQQLSERVQLPPLSPFPALSSQQDDLFH